MDQLNHHEPGGQVDYGTGELRDGAAHFSGVVYPRLIDGIHLPSLTGFVERLMHDTERADPAKNWCTQWWRHPEAITIFRALELSIPKAEKDLNSWILHDVAPQLSYLFHDEGPFRSCKPGLHKYKNTPYEGNADHWVPYRATKAPLHEKERPA